jgi:NADPH2:quinone reductase
VHYTADPAWLAEGAAELFDLVASGTIRSEVHQRFALAEAAQAHRDLEGRRTTGATVLVP